MFDSSLVPFPTLPSSLTPLLHPHHPLWIHGSLNPYLIPPPPPNHPNPTTTPLHLPLRPPVPPLLPPPSRPLLLPTTNRPHCGFTPAGRNLTPTLRQPPLMNPRPLRPHRNHSHRPRPSPSALTTIYANLTRNMPISPFYLPLKHRSPPSRLSLPPPGRLPWMLKLTHYTATKHGVLFLVTLTKILLGVNGYIGLNIIRMVRLSNTRLVLWLRVFISDQKASHTSSANQASDDHETANEAEIPTVIDIQQSPEPKKYRKVSILPLVFLIFFEVCGGPFGSEDTVRAAGPLLALIGFLVVPLIWSVPEALITAEMSTMFPENGGYVVWVSAALGEYWGFQQGWMKWLSGVIDNALYPVLFLDYLKLVIPVFSHGYPRVLAIIVLTFGLTYMNYRGLTIVGWTSVVLGVACMVPFVIMGFISLPKLEPSRWLVVDLHNIQWSLYLNTLFWNLHYWDSISTLVGEVQNPGKTLPRALLYALIMVICSYFFPLLTGTGAIPLNRDSWTDGYFATVAKTIGGTWLCWWVQGGAALSSMGMFLAEMSSDSFQLLGMGDRGMLPEMFSKRSKHGTPILGILFSASGVLVLSWLEFDEIVAAENFLYCFGMILEIIAFLVLRIKHPGLDRPYKIPIGRVGCILMCVPPTVLMCVVLAFSTLRVFVVSIIAVVIGLCLQPGLKYVKKKRWLKFSTSTSLPDLRFKVHDADDNAESLAP